MIVFAAFLSLAICTSRTCECKAGAQDSQAQQNQSVVDAARRSREQKKTTAPPARVWTNDDFETQHTNHARKDFTELAPASPQGEPGNPRAGGTAKAPDQAPDAIKNAPGTNSKESEEAAAEDAEIARLKKELASAENALTWRRRQFLLQQNTIYSNPAYTTTHAGKSDLESAQLQIDQIQQQVDSLKGPLANLEWRQWRRTQSVRTDSGSPEENYRPVPPAALVLPQP
jgi:hypothetical protein